MTASVSLKEEGAWQHLQDYYNANGSKLNILKLFQSDPQRFNKYSLKLSTPQDGEILLDYSKNRVDDNVWPLLLNLAKSRGIEAARDAMFSGQKINFTEGRAVLHIPLRNRSNREILVDGKNVAPDVNAVLAHIKEFTEQVISGTWKGSD